MALTCTNRVVADRHPSVGRVKRRWVVGLGRNPANRALKSVNDRSSYRDSGRHCARNVEASERREGLIDNVADFDAEFFNISPREVRTMDPRQRLALELTWELLELSYVVPESVHGDRVAVCIGAMNDQSNLLPRFRPLTGCALALGPATLWTTPSY
nr:beta-ketoacyl synthase N-terminal-like domain-containing protein [Mycobacterium riyadhense]